MFTDRIKRLAGLARVPRAAWALGVAIVCLWETPARQPTEYEVKAAFLLNFARFVEWSPKVFRDGSAPLVIGVLGQDPFGDALTRIVRGQKAQGRSIEIRYLKDDEETSGCQLLFFSRSHAGKIESVLKRIQRQPILTVSDDGSWVRQGVMIGFSIVDKSVRFDINAKAAQAAELKLSSKLLAVARSVINS